MKQLVLLQVLIVGATLDVEAESYVFVDVAVVPMDSERVVEHRSVLVQDGRIVAITDAADVRAPSGATVIEGDGRFLMPGLADMHVHIREAAEFSLFLANGVTTVRNMWGADQHLAWREEIELGKIDGPTIYTVGPLIDGDPPVWPGCAVAATAEEGRELVRRQHSQGFDFIKVYSRLRLDVYNAIIDEAGRLETPVIGHVPTDVGLQRALDARQSSIEHLHGYMRACQPDHNKGVLRGSALAAAFDISMAPDVVTATAEAGTANCVTLIVTDRSGGASEKEIQSWFADPSLRYVSTTIRAQWNRSRSAAKAGESLALAHRAREIRRMLTRALHDAGTPILLGTDSPNPLVVPGFAIHVELANLVEAGLTPYEAIRCGTANAADFLGASEEFGAVAVGRRADLILLDANPLEDVANLKRLAGVMVRGRWLPAGALQDRLDALAERYAEQEKGDGDGIRSAP